MLTGLEHRAKLYWFGAAGRGRRDAAGSSVPQQMQLEFSRVLTARRPMPAAMQDHAGRHLDHEVSDPLSLVPGQDRAPCGVNLLLSSLMRCYWSSKTSFMPVSTCDHNMLIASSRRVLDSFRLAQGVVTVLLSILCIMQSSCCLPTTCCKDGCAPILCGAHTIVQLSTSMAKTVPADLNATQPARMMVQRYARTQDVKRGIARCYSSQANNLSRASAWNSHFTFHTSHAYCRTWIVRPQSQCRKHAVAQHTALGTLLTPPTMQLRLAHAQDLQRPQPGWNMHAACAVAGSGVATPDRLHSALAAQWYCHRAAAALACKCRSWRRAEEVAHLCI